MPTFIRSLQLSTLLFVKKIFSQESGTSFLNFTLPQGLAKVDSFLLSVSLSPCSRVLCAASLPRQPSARFRSFSNSHNFPEKLFFSKHRDPHWIHHCRASFLKKQDLSDPGHRGQWQLLKAAVTLVTCPRINQERWQLGVACKELEQRDGSSWAREAEWKRCVCLPAAFI